MHCKVGSMLIISHSGYVRQKIRTSAGLIMSLLPHRLHLSLNTDCLMLVEGLHDPVHGEYIHSIQEMSVELP